MSDVCSCPAEAGAAGCDLRTSGEKVPCPKCQQIGKPVSLMTLKALLAIPLTELFQVEYRFCRTAGCSTVYFSTDGFQSFVEEDLRERVHQKHPTDEAAFVCYCFRHTTATMRNELANTGASTVVTAITQGIQAGQCACEIRNPQGSCCLGNVLAVLQRLKVPE